MLTRPLRKCRCPKCRHQITVEDIYRQTIKNNTQGKHSSLVIYYKCGVCNTPNKYEISTEDYTDCQTYQMMYARVLVDIFNSENTEQIAFDQRNRKPISKQECGNFKKYLEDSNDIWDDLSRM